jgi:hypothetical protein
MIVRERETFRASPHKTLSTAIHFIYAKAILFEHVDTVNICILLIQRRRESRMELRLQTIKAGSQAGPSQETSP